MAAVFGRLEVIKFLSQTFATMVHDRDNSGCTMLHRAALMGHCEVARYLIEEVKMDPQDRTKVCRVECENGVCPKYRLFVLIVACDNIIDVTWTYV